MSYLSLVTPYLWVESRLTAYLTAKRFQIGAIRLREVHPFG